MVCLQVGCWEAGGNADKDYGAINTHPLEHCPGDHTTSLQFSVLERALGLESEQWVRTLASMIREYLLFTTVSTAPRTNLPAAGALLMFVESVSERMSQ